MNGASSPPPLPPHSPMDGASGPPPPGSPEVVVYARPGCHLCEEALEGLLGLHREGYRFELREVDIESEELLLRRLLERIPVVEVAGEVVSELVFDGDAVRASLDTVGAWRR